jgi:hypothetical protein|tara:strand:- start:1890 stop:2498 length:609 start_codon:yes stop_codon:yes gene_type:complete
MSFEEARVICIVYFSAIVPLILLYKYRRNLPSWIILIYVCSFFVCAIGWEIWFTYGIIEGDSVIERRSETLNTWIPMHINWIVNSLADAGAVCLGGLWLMWRLSGRDILIFDHWRWNSFLILLVWCVGQNLLVELFLYHDQLAEGKDLSWAPLIPTGNYFNPLLFEFNGRAVMFQTQLPWIILPSALYALVIYCARKEARVG